MLHLMKGLFGGRKWIDTEMLPHNRVYSESSGGKSTVLVKLPNLKWDSQQMFAEANQNQ